MTLSGKFAHPTESFPELHRSLANWLSPYLAPGNLVAVAILGSSYSIVGKFAARWACPNPSVTAIWVPVGIALAAFLLRGNRVWPGVFIGAFFLSITMARPIPISMGLALGNTIGPLVGASLVNNYAGGISAFFKARDFLRFIFFAALIAPTVCASFGASLLCLGGVAPLRDFSMLWFDWWVGDMLGVLFVTPFLVLLLGHRHHSLGLAEPFEIAALITGVIIVCVLNFSPRPMHLIPGNGELFLCAPFLIWAALRFCPLEAAGATLTMGGLAMWGSLYGIGHLNTFGLPLFVGGLMGLGTAMTMTVAAASAEQKRATKDVLGMYCVLRDRKENEIRVLQDTVEALQAELARKEDQSRKRLV
jgi:integral membrane sensor domain MASE1